MLFAHRRRRAALVPLAMLLALALSVQATTDSRRVTFTIPTAPIAQGLDALPLVTPEGAVRRVAVVLRDDLRLPLPAEVTLRLYATPKLFEQGLVQDAGVAPPLAATISGLAVGASLPSRLFLLEPRIGLGESADARRSVREWLRVVAHEMTHVGQVELAGGQGRASQWMAEGVADWAALVVLDRLRLQPMRTERPGAINVPLAPIDLGGVEDPRDFIERTRRDGTATTYGVSLALADRLIDRYGFARTRDYFRAFAHERALNFRAVFGETADDVVRRLWPPACHC